MNTVKSFSLRRPAIRRLSHLLAVLSLTLALAVSLVLPAASIRAQAFVRDEGTYVLPDEIPNFASDYAVLVQTDTGRIVASKNSDQRINPASMTKVMTLLVACEHITNLDDPVTITQDEIDYAYTNGCTRAGFVAGEQTTVRNLLFGLILPSGADAAVALARYIGGTDENFVAMMNTKAAELGLQNTHFANCVGLTDPAHYTTCEDMAVIMTAAVTNPTAFGVLSAQNYTISGTPQHPQGIALTNLFLQRMSGQPLLPGTCYSAKTGYTQAAGNCAASFFLSSQTGHPYICVTAHSSSSQQCVIDQLILYAVYAGTGPGSIANPVGTGTDTVADTSADTAANTTTDTVAAVNSISPIE